MTQQTAGGLMRKRELQELVPMSDSTRYRQERAGHHPRRIHLSSTLCVWRRKDVEAFVRDPLAWIAEQEFQKAVA